MAARKTSIIPYSVYENESEDESASSGSESVSSKTDASTDQDAGPIKLEYVTPRGLSLGEPGGGLVPPASIVRAIKQHSPLWLGVGRQPTFLRRNLRAGLLSYCERAGIRVHPARDLDASVVCLVFRCTRQTLSHEDGGDDGEAAGDWYEHQVTMNVREGWTCPICDCLGSVATMEAMVLHFRWAHDQVGIDWEPVSEVNNLASIIF